MNPVGDPFCIVRAADESPSAPCVIAGREALSFEAMSEESSRASTWLQAQNLPPRAPVAVRARPTVPSLSMLYALFALGHPLVPLHPRWTPNDLERVLRTFRPALVVLDDAWRGAPSAAPVRLSALDLSTDAALALVPTSGSSGPPKGVILSRSAFAASAAAHSANVGWLESDRWLLGLPLAHVGGLSVVTRCLAARRAIVLPENGTANATQLLARAIATARVTLLSLVPAQLARLLSVAGFELPTAVRAILLGGAPASGELLERAAVRHWPVLPTYGLTEGCSQVSTQAYARRFSADADVGRPLAGTELRLVDGEIQIRGPTLFSGYYPGGERPLTQDGWFPTGDLGELDPRGGLLVRGRKSELIITGGEKVLPSDVEAELVLCPGVAAACVLGVADPIFGEIVAAVVVREPDSGLSESDVLEFGRRRLASYRRPRRVVFVAALPETPSGKLDRTRARALLEAASDES